MSLNTPPPMPFWQRFQIEVGGRWQLTPSGGLTWREWIFSPYCNCVWPGKLIRYSEVSREMWKPGFIGPFANGSAPARFWWASVALRLLGLDLGLAGFYRPNPAVLNASPSFGDEGLQARSEASEPNNPPSSDGEAR